jgi:hypothetical protein
MSQMRNVSGPCKRLLMGEADEHPAFARLDANDPGCVKTSWML